MFSTLFNAADLSSKVNQVLQDEVGRIQGQIERDFVPREKYEHIKFLYELLDNNCEQLIRTVNKLDQECKRKSFTITQLSKQLHTVPSLKQLGKYTLTQHPLTETVPKEQAGKIHKTWYYPADKSFLPSVAPFKQTYGLPKPGSSLNPVIVIEDDIFDDITDDVINEMGMQAPKEEKVEDIEDDSDDDVIMNVQDDDSLFGDDEDE